MKLLSKHPDIYRFRLVAAALSWFCLAQVLLPWLNLTRWDGTSCTGTTTEDPPISTNPDWIICSMQRVSHQVISLNLILNTKLRGSNNRHTIFRWGLGNRSHVRWCQGGHSQLWQEHLPLQTPEQLAALGQRKTGEGHRDCHGMCKSNTRYTLNTD